MTSQSKAGNERTCLIVSACFAIVLVLIAVAFYATWSRIVAVRVDDQLAELRAAGMPCSPNELEEYYSVPASQADVTRLWLAALARFDTEAFREQAAPLPIVGRDEEIPPPGQDWEKLAEVESLLDEYSEAMQLLHEASEKGPIARFPTQLDQGFSMLLPHTQNLRNGARVLVLEIHARAHAGDAQGAAKSIRACFRMSRAIEREPFLVSQLVRIACGKMALQAISDLLPHNDFSDDDLALLQETIRESDYRNGIRRALVGERAMGIVAFRNAPSLPVNNEDLARYLEIVTKLADALNTSWTEGLETAAQIRADVQIASPLDQIRFPRSALLLPSVDASFEAGARAEALRDTVDVAIAAERYRLAHGKSPESIPELVPRYLASAPIDPFDGQPIRYSLTEDGIRIWSVGRDRKDDRGQIGEDMDADVGVFLGQNP
jgi:hypothetical protein